MSSTHSPYQVSDQWLGQPRRVRVIVVGAGIAGIAAVKLFREMFAGKPADLVVYEKNHDVTGTWLENRYPGCACDVPAHGYTYTWEGNPRWSKPYVGAEEIYEYYKGRALAYGVFDHLRLQHRVTSATWEKTRGLWTLTIENLVDGTQILDECDVLINAGGFLNNWKWPAIDGIENFKGHKVHSAKWDDDYSFEGKTVGVIGSGSSAIQIVPIIQKKAKSLVSFNRSPTWISPEFAAEFAPEGRQAVFSEEQKRKWANNPLEFLDYRRKLGSSANRFYSLHFKNSAIQRELLEKFKSTMAQRLGREDLASLLIPSFAVGCRRMTPGHGYLEALAADNVVVRGDSISHITNDGIQMVDGTHLSFDVIICATGFDTSYRPSFSLIGTNDRDLRDYWQDEPRSYLSIAVDGYPNYFMATGPNFPLANGDLLACLEQSLKYAFMVTQKLQTQNVKSMSPTPEAVDEFQEHKDTLMKELVWTSHCRYKNGKIDGKVWGPYCGSALHFMELLSQPRWEDYSIEYTGSNRFRYLGKGHTEREMTGGDLAWYLKESNAEANILSKI
ncbi:FAD/NAD(P)-binding domain-containing protein [Lophiostoma macrostomum CBS 122681]|uniref:FAD/NAD(P)-binding domain-containing protein n=1 Tax=Lophiostoma macrostomum CBS 122681 TaxID=1314788 RepID=A0A6A6TH35_9PLEO|nr:FAD/NAD(P)-binding domain-containing protein [Lophiostoma macrostomum CBS 122681]